MAPRLSMAQSTRADPKEKALHGDLCRRRAISNLRERPCLKAVTDRKFFGKFRVSVMLDSNGSNTTAAAGVALLAKGVVRSQGKKAVVLAGTGPVGMRAAALLALEGAHRRRSPAARRTRPRPPLQRLASRFGVQIMPPSKPPIKAARGHRCLRGTNIVFAAGAAAQGPSRRGRHGAIDVHGIELRG